MTCSCDFSLLKQQETDTSLCLGCLLKPRANIMFEPGKLKIVSLQGELMDPRLVPKSQHGADPDPLNVVVSEESLAFFGA